jgi:pimeloyl-ACP methyl ester carboxylesterase
VQLYVRDVGSGDPPVLVLHGGWGYAYYPFDDQVAGIARRFVIPDRTGYGRSPRVGLLPPGFHEAAAREMATVLDGMGIARCALWGHSDGAVIAVWMALHAPARYIGLVLEALHLDREKPRSRAFFTQMAEDPDGFGEQVAARLAADHGHDHWRTIIRADGRAWLDIAATPRIDLYDHRLGELSLPVLVLHGAEDPRTEPGELDRLQRDVPHARIHVLPGARHSPHSEGATAALCTRLVREFLDEHA